MTSSRFAANHWAAGVHQGKPLAEICAIAVMAKSPLSGAVKTRLVPPLTFEEARALSASFLLDVTENIRLAGRHAPIQGHVAYAPAGAEMSFDGKLAPGTRLVLADGSVDMPSNVRGFGRCLLQAAQGLFALGYGSICLLNADSPTLPTEYLREAVEVLSTPGERIVLGPADDGGYYAIGMRAPCAELFADIAWSTKHVTAETCDRAGRAGLQIVMLPTWYDVDDYTTLRRLMRDLSDMNARGSAGPTPYPAPATAECFIRLGIGGFLGDARLSRVVNTAADDMQT